ncbi:hypothetical protein QBC42DRAFT_282064 [Cladorrhinum samala]|uniref:Uncharacterized protein n=1 Tax=Cladorrhinum samala TaxID=585594 RepID=A0AAV9I0T4_9PEZI|nr:hypothetical protein QBC42DRAFT_282064 [Cladorrhinum samala]
MDASTKESRSLSRTDWRSTSSTLLDQDSQLSNVSQESDNTDRLGLSLSTSWTRFLNAVQCSQEVWGLKRSLEDHTRNTSASIGSLHKEIIDCHEIATTSAIEARSRIEQIASGINEIAPLKAAIATLQEHAARDDADIKRRFEVHREALERVRNLASQGATTKTVESLQAEIRDLRQEKLQVGQKPGSVEERTTALESELVSWKTDMENRLDTLELQFITEKKAAEIKLRDTEKEIAALRHQTETQTAGMSKQLSRLEQNLTQISSEPRHTLPPAILVFLDELVGQKDNLMKMLEDASRETITALTPETPPEMVQSHEPVTKQLTKRKAESDLPQPVPKRASSSAPIETLFDRNSEDYKALKAWYVICREEYKSHPPKSDVAFIWKFISSIENPDVSKTIQEALLQALPDIAKGLTWKKFREALVYHPS